MPFCQFTLLSSKLPYLSRIDTEQLITASSYPHLKPKDQQKVKSSLQRMTERIDNDRIELDKQKFKDKFINKWQPK